MLFRSGTADPGPDAATPDIPEDTPPIDACAGSTTFLVGAAVQDITGPIAGRGMMGYVIMSQVDEGLQMRLRARAFVISSPCNGRRVAMAITDDQYLPQAVQMEVVRRLKATYGDLYTDANVLLAATHNHSGPGGLSAYPLYQFAPVGGFDPWHFEAVVDGIVKAIGRAHDGLKPGRVRFAQGTLRDTGLNRSPDAFAADPQADRDLFPDGIDTTNTVLRLETTDGTPVGAIDVFGVHVTSVGANNKLVTCDNKGYAAYRFERAMGTDHRAGAGFAAGFFNATAGDVTPNVDGFSFEAKDGEKDYADMARSAGKQYDGARALFDGEMEDLSGPVDSRAQFARMDAVTVSAAYGDGQERHTCPAATGLSMFAGGNMDWPGSMPQGQTCASVEGAECTDCQAEKPIAVPIGDSDPVLAPNVLPFQLLRIGSLAFVAVPFETTTMAGFRIRRTVAATLAPAGVRHVVLISYANAYASYMTTREEYAVQDYEGASTQFGPWQQAAVAQVLDGLAAAMRDGAAVDPGPAPVDRVITTTLLGDLTGHDLPPAGRQFGDVMQDAPESVNRGATVTATFASAHPDNDFRIGGTFLEVRRKDGQAWTTVADDGAFETRMRWSKGLADTCPPEGGCSQATVRWDVPADAAPGTYRLHHLGAWKDGEGGLHEFEGASREFEVR